MKVNDYEDLMNCLKKKLLSMADDYDEASRDTKSYSLREKFRIRAQATDNACRVMEETILEIMNRKADEVTDEK